MGAWHYETTVLCKHLERYKRDETPCRQCERGTAWKVRINHTGWQTSGSSDRRTLCIRLLLAPIWCFFSGYFYQYICSKVGFIIIYMRQLEQHKHMKGYRYL